MTIKLVAEFGSSPAPDWDFDLWCSAAAQSGATSCKAQLFRAEHFPLVEHASKHALEFPRARLPEFVAAAHVRGLGCGVSVFDAEAVELAARHCDWLKLAAREQDNTPLAKRTFEFAWSHGRKPIIRSISVLNSDSFFCAGTVIHLYAMQRYPSPMAQALVNVVRTARFFRGWPYIAGWGWSSHTTGLLDCILAARLGASVIEKHLCILSSDLEASHSLMPEKFAVLSRIIRG